MSFTQHTSARLLIWLTLCAIPAQALPASACGCDGNASCCQSDDLIRGSCRKEGPATTQDCSQQRVAGPCRCTGAKVCRCGDSSPCCQSRPSCCSANSCCSTPGSGGESGCQCGPNCQCGTSDAPTPPVAPAPIENSPEKSSSDAAVTAASLAAVYQPRDTRRTAPYASLEMDVLAALDRCASLCRFTL